MLHISELDWKKVDKVEDVVKVGETITVKLLEIDERSGKMRLSLKALLEKPEGYVEPERKPRPSGGDRDRNNRNYSRGNDRGPQRGRGGDRNR